MAGQANAIKNNAQRFRLCFQATYFISAPSITPVFQGCSSSFLKKKTNHKQIQIPSLLVSNRGEGICSLKQILVSWSLLQCILPLAGAINTESWIFCIRWICVPRQTIAPLILVHNHMLKQLFWVRQVKALCRVVSWGPHTYLVESDIILPSYLCWHRKC